MQVSFLVDTFGYYDPKPLKQEKGPKKHFFTDVEHCHHSNLHTDEFNLAVKSVRSVGKVSVAHSFSHRTHSRMRSIGDGLGCDGEFGRRVLAPRQHAARCALGSNGFLCHGAQTLSAYGSPSDLR